MIGLAPLFTALREAGLPVGVAEVARLQRIFALSLAPSGDRLQGVLRAVLVKSAEDRAVFERVFETWIEQVEQEVRLQEEPPERVRDRRIFPARPRRRPLRFVGRAAAAVLLLAASLSLNSHFAGAPRRDASSKPSVTGRGSATRPPASKPVAPIPEVIRSRTFITSVPVIDVTPGLWPGWLPLGLGLVALIAAGALWLASLRRSWRSEPAPAPSRKGPPRVFLSPPAEAGLQLLQPREEEALVWGIGSFVAEEPTRRLDLPATVRATARSAGVPHLVFHAARYPREVWLWIDEAADDPAIPRLAEEVATALEAHGLPVEQALFRGIPDWLVHAAGAVFSPNEMDERRDAALVAILTDGRVLARHYAADDRRVGLDVLLRGLSHWPRLAFVDFSPPPGDLSTILAPHLIETIVPQKLAGYLGTDESLRRRTVVEADDIAVWAAACALAPAPVDEIRAFELRRRLGLAASPWALRKLRAEAPGPPGRLQWEPGKRAQRINWLRAAQAQTEKGLAPESFLGQALAFWEEVYDRELEARTEGEAGALWRETPAYQNLVMERALLALWNENGVEEAVRSLYSLHGGALRETIEEHLGLLAPLDWGAPDDLHLPWRWEARAGAERDMLLAIGLGGGMPPVRLVRPGRLWLGLALCLGLATGAITAALSGWRSVPPVLRYGPGRPADTQDDVRQTPDGFWDVAVATRKTSASRSVTSASRVNVDWAKQKRPCVESLAKGRGEIWSCGSFPAPQRFSELARRRAMLLAAAPGTAGDRSAQELAIDLLDSGSADLVILKPDGKPSGLGSATLEGQELLVIPRSSWTDLAQRLRFEGTLPLRQVWPGVRLLEGDPGALLRGLSDCRNGETLLDQGMVFVYVCPGTFRMGSTEEDPQGYPNERPAHEVILSEYWIGRYEVTEAQYSGGGVSKRPVTDVNWFNARSFCEQHGWRLPTEAEWEYAARAGATTAWVFGDDERALGDYAWFGESLEGGSHPVGTKKPTPWGLYDMYGNVWEWVADWYGPYQSGPQKDPQGPEAGDARVLRGGAFVDSPRDLRSAVRGWFRPEVRGRGFGFRCARGPRRQP